MMMREREREKKKRVLFTLFRLVLYYCNFIIGCVFFSRRLVSCETVKKEYVVVKSNCKSHQKIRALEKKNPKPHAKKESVSLLTTKRARKKERRMKVTALSLWKWQGQNADPVCLGKAEDVEEFGYFQRASVREMLTFISKTIVARTQPGQRQSVEQDQYLVHVINRNGLAAIAVMDKEYPSRSAFCVLQKICDDYCDKFGEENWKTVTEDDAKGNEGMEEAIKNYQDPMAADKILKIQRELDDTKVVLHKTIDSVLARGEKLDNLVDKSTDLSLASQMFYKQARKQNQCCNLM